MLGIATSTWPSGWPASLTTAPVMVTGSWAHPPRAAPASAARMVTAPTTPRTDKDMGLLRGDVVGRRTADFGHARPWDLSGLSICDERRQGVPNRGAGAMSGAENTKPGASAP